jgi:hypothetical protein
MTRRFAVAAAAFVALSSFALHVPEAGAFTSVTKLCLNNARKAFQLNKANASQTITSQYVADRAACFGPGQACATTCQGTLNGCVANPNATKAQCASDCNTAFKTAVQACTDATDPLGCATQSRIDRLNCVNGCSANLATQGAIDACNRAYSDCVQQCASCAPGSTCGNP